MSDEAAEQPKGVMILSIIGSLALIMWPFWYPATYFFKEQLFWQLGFAILGDILLVRGLVSLARGKIGLAFKTLIFCVLIVGYSVLRSHWNDVPFAAIDRNEALVAVGWPEPKSGYGMEYYLFAKMARQPNWLDFTRACLGADFQLFRQPVASHLPFGELEKKCDTPEDVKQAYNIDMKAEIERDLQKMQATLKVVTASDFDLKGCFDKGDCQYLQGSLYYKPHRQKVPFVNPLLSSSSNPQTETAGSMSYNHEWSQARGHRAQQMKAILAGDFTSAAACSASKLCEEFRYLAE